ncbi:60S ribosomal protein L19 [Ophiocordyceps camponoti-floridani]|uniref:60S ribosomal protein L19 n=1 Tax=Ophiocordyceps camponoti-floridani TaxID=2030778 RepID=A0A8H4QD70_9HYPO|nr:60S ribosomal protein L19 [Ophiocordyceps camponoti-floridani]
MSSNASVPWPPVRPSRRMRMRNGTFVIPSTGERSKRQVTLRASAGDGPWGYGSSSSNDTADGSPAAVEGPVTASVLALWRWLGSDEGHQVLKCTLAYLLGSLGTLWPLLSDFLGHRDGKHIVATITVYFHPARTVGSMLEAVFVAIVAVAYAEAVSLLSMAAAIASRTSMGSVVPAHAIVLVVFVGGGLGFVGWVKQKMNHPLVNVASTLASIAIISVVTKEQSIQDGYFSGGKIFQVFKMLVVGISFTVAVNLVVWRESARHVLRSSIASAMACLGDKLCIIAKSFLDGSEEEINSPAYLAITSQYASVFEEMNRTIREAKLEYYFLGHEAIYRLDKRMRKSVEATSQAIGGLRSALDTQMALLREEPSAASQTAPSSSATSSPAPPLASPRLVRASSSLTGEMRGPLSIIREMDDESRLAMLSRSDPSLDRSAFFRTPSDIVALFMALLGPSMKSLVFSLAEILRECPFDHESMKHVTINDRLRRSLGDALSLYNGAKADALRELYRSMELGRSSSEKVKADIEEVAAACGHFSFTLQAVAEELDSYLDILEELKQTSANTSRSWGWLTFWTYWTPFDRWPRASVDAERQPLLPKPSIKKTALPRGMPTSMVKRRDAFSWNAAPQSSAFVRRMSQSMLTVLRFLDREDVAFGIKVGIGAVLWAMFAFIPSTRPMYQHWRGEWGLLSYMIVVGMTTGASNTTSTSRFIGTMIGATCACLSWLACDDNPYLLALFGWLVAFWNFYLILVKKKAPLGRISLLAYNVIVLYAYSLSLDVDDDDDDEGGTTPLIFNITYHRVVAVTLGILWGMIVCRLLWPISGRRKFREGLSVLYLQLGLIWKRGSLKVLVDGQGSLNYMQEGEQMALQRYAFKLDSLREAAKSEFELRGPFPHEAYGRIMRSTRHILDGFYAMRLITQRRFTLSGGERALLAATVDERARLCQRTSHVFQVLASSIMLEIPLTDAIPTIDGIKDLLLGRIHLFRGQCMAAGLDGGAVVAQERDFALLYAYTLVTAQVADELKKVRAEIEHLFGVLNQEDLLLEYT